MGRGMWSQLFGSFGPPGGANLGAGSLQLAVMLHIQWRSSAHAAPSLVPTAVSQKVGI